jgi:hypothetical protein
MKRENKFLNKFNKVLIEHDQNEDPNNRIRKEALQ